MNLTDFLKELVIKGWKFWSEENRLYYDAPLEQSNPELLAKLKLHKKEIIKLLEKNSDIFNVSPLSHGQKALWFIWQLDPESAAYNQVFSARICDDLDVALLHSAFLELLERHPCLRSTFPKFGEEAIQQIHQKFELDWKQIDASAWNEKELYSQVTAESQLPFNLEQELIMRVRLFTCSKKKHILLLTIHHIATDGWSLAIILRELGKLYQAQTDGVYVSLPPLKNSYSDYVRFQKKMLYNEQGEKLFRYWQEKLKGELPALNLPIDKPRPPIQTHNGASVYFKLSEQLTRQLKQLGTSTGVTLYMTLLAAFQVLLYRYNGQEDILVASPVVGRLQSEFRGIVGYIANQVVLRADLSNNPSFKDFLNQIRQTVLEALTHQDYPFVLLVEKLQPHRDLSRSPIFQASFALQKLLKSQDIHKLFVNESQTIVDWGGLKLKPFLIPQQEGQFDLDLEVLEGTSSITGSFKYNTDLFNGETIERMATYYQNLLSAIVENPLQKVAKLSLLSEAERHELLVEWNDTATEYPKHKCIHRLFEEQVEKTPINVAVVFEKEKLTYQQLNQRANQLAHYLKTLGVRPEVLVGICVERSIEMVVGLLSILKAGGAYVPLDPNYPKERLSHMLSDSGVEVLVTQNSLLESLPDCNARVVCLDRDEIEQHSKDNLDVEVSSDNLAYVIYTSGSTGKPKGVQICHQGVVNFLNSMLHSPGLTEEDTLYALTTISFDIAALELYLPLILGAKVIVGSNEITSDGNWLLSELIQSRTTVMQATPATWQMLLTAGWSDNYPLKVLCGGEALSGSLTHQILETGSQLWNMYGPTEATIWSTIYNIAANNTLTSTNNLTASIGRPIANTQIYILDSHLQPVPVGVPGELYIGGDGLARGYLNRPQLTQEKFIQNPFSNPKSKRLYKTGDLTRYLSDGNIEFLGRIDNQVKIRGFRIELGEIEASLATHPQVNQAVVIAQEENTTGNKRLVAYSVTNDKITTQQLREHIKAQLPDYMVPSAFVTLDTLPLTPNGKIDRKALPAPDIVQRDTVYVAPRTQSEQILANIWQELLLVTRVSIYDNFFEIGGDSILSIQVISRAKNMGIQISAKQIFQHQTIAELATVANTTVRAQCNQGIVTGVAPLTPIQHWFFRQHIEEPHHYNQSVLLQISLNIKQDLLEKAVEKLIEHHDALRLRFTQIGSEYKQSNQGFENEVPHTVIDLSSTPQEKQSQAIETIATEFQTSLNLSTGPIMQVVMFHLGDKVDGRLLIIIHHLAVDGVSWRILLADLETIYQQLIRQQSIQLSPKTTAFIDWAKKLNNYAQSNSIKQELDYWVNQPWSITKPLPLDYAHNQQQNTVGSAGIVSVKLNSLETSILLGSINEAYNTQISDILLSAASISLAQWTGDSKVLINLEGDGREELFDDVDSSSTVGCFTSLFPVLLQLPEDEQLASTIKSIKEQLRAIPNRGIGYGILLYLCEDTALTEKLKTIPTPEISFNYLGQFDQLQSEIGWKLASESTGGNHSSKMIREHLLDINALVVEGELQVSWIYSSNFHSHQRIKNLAQSYLQAIRSIISHCQLNENFGYTPSDFANSQLNQSELDELLESLDK